MLNTSSDVNAARQSASTSIAHGHTLMTTLSKHEEFNMVSRVASALATLQQVESELQIKQRDAYKNEQR